MPTGCPNQAATHNGPKTGPSSPTERRTRHLWASPQKHKPTPQKGHKWHETENQPNKQEQDSNDS